MNGEMIDRYLERIGLTLSDRRPTAANLARLQRAHLFSVPYENLDVMRGIPLSLEEEDLFDKIVVRRRGGYCFELNGLFSMLLTSLGYEVTGYFARFLRSAAGRIPMRGHMVMRVRACDCEDGFLADAATGNGSPEEPMRLREGEECRQNDELYRLNRQQDGTWLLSERKGEGWGPVYQFSEEPQLPVDYRVASFYCEHAPDSTSRQKWIVSLRRPGGRDTVDGEEFRRFRNGAVETYIPKDEEERDALLRERFGIVL